MFPFVEIHFASEELDIPVCGTIKFPLGTPTFPLLENLRFPRKIIVPPPKSTEI